MDSIAEMLRGKIDDSTLESLGSEFNLDKDKTGSVVDSAIPLILSGLGKNAADKDQAKGIEKALDKDHDGSILDHVSESVKDKSVQADGSKILSHVFGDKVDAMSSGVAKKQAIDSSAAKGIMGKLAPLIMGQLGKTKKQKGLDLGGLTDLLGGEKKKADKKLGGILGMLDRDKDGSVVDDAIDLISNLF